MNKRTITLMFLATLGVAACGSDVAPASQAAGGPAPVATAAPAAPATTTTVPAPVAGASIAVKAATSPFGQILVDPAGNTLYAFTNDTDAQSTCTGTCAEAWPPVIVDPSWSVAPGLDAGVFSTIIRDDGSEQLTAGRYPLYLFSGDARAGDINGQGSGGVWFVVDTKAVPVEDATDGTADTTADNTDTDGTADTAGTDDTDGTADTAADADSDSGKDSGYGTEETAVDSAPDTTVADAAEEVAAPLVTTADNPLGSIMVGENGNTLYGFTPDLDTTPTCVDGCATAWPPVIVDADFDVTSLPNAELFSIVERADGSMQLKAGKWPLYFFSGDAAPGETNGQGSGGKWFVVAADAKLIK